MGDIKDFLKAFLPREQKPEADWEKAKRAGLENEMMQTAKGIGEGTMGEIRLGAGLPKTAEILGDFGKVIRRDVTPSLGEALESAAQKRAIQKEVPTMDRLNELKQTQEQMKQMADMMHPEEFKQAQEQLQALKNEELGIEMDPLEKIRKEKEMKAAANRSSFNKIKNTLGE